MRRFDGLLKKILLDVLFDDNDDDDIEDTFVMSSSSTRKRRCMFQIDSKIQDSQFLKNSCFQPTNFHDDLSEYLAVLVVHS